jgi:hypothetical protein
METKILTGVVVSRPVVVPNRVCNVIFLVIDVENIGCIKFYCAVDMVDTYDKCSIAHLEEKTFSDVAVSSEGDYVHLMVKSLDASGFNREIIDFYNESLGIGNPKVCPY